MIDDLIQARVPAAPPPASPAQRIAWLFRRTLRAGGVHPLLPAVLAFQAVDGGLPRIDFDAPAAGAVEDGATTRWHITPAALSASIRDLPGLPKALTDALALLRRDDNNAENLARCLERDQSLTARALRVANSAFYGVSGRVGSVRNAIDILGRRAVQSLLTTSALAAQFELPADSSFDRGHFWRHTMAAAMLARQLAGQLRLDEESAFTAALLHDIGALALATRFPEPAHAVAMVVRSSDLPTHEVERRLLGMDHAEVGAQVARHWHFPDAIVAAIRHHHDPLRSPAAASDLCALVHLVDAIAHALDLDGHPQEAVPDIELDHWQGFGLATRDLVETMGEARAQVAELCKALGV